jgi:hypothetical protein
MNNALTNITGSITLMPKCGHCYDFRKEDYRSRKTIWLVPHVIKYREGSQIITWRCNWGNTCESDCIYAMTRERNELAFSHLEVNNKAPH